LRLKEYFPLLIVAIVVMGLAVVPATAELKTTQTDDGKTLISNGTYWISLDPIGDHIVGDQFFINGTTNSPEGNNLMIEMFGSNCFHSQMNIYSCRYFGPINATVKKSSNLTGYFSIEVNTSGHEPDTYDISITSGSGNNLLGEVTQWNLTTKPSTTSTFSQNTSLSGFGFLLCICSIFVSLLIVTRRKSK
jgi:hypothetical protein